MMRPGPRTITLSGTLALCALAWVYLLVEGAGMSTMDGMSGTMDPSRSWALAEWSYLCIMWSIMMVAMMLPSALPTILMVARVGTARRELYGAAASPGPTPAFITGYLAAWTAYSVMAASIQWGLHGVLLISDGMASVSPVLSGGLLVGAGLFQFTPLKSRCVTHCRSPMSYLMSRWREGRWGAFRMGLGHGSYCVGCCWALMALLFVLGVMNLIWVTVLAAIVLLEKALPDRHWLTSGIGVTLIGWGLVVLLRPASGVLVGWMP